MINDMKLIFTLQKVEIKLTNQIRFVSIQGIKIAKVRLGLGSLSNDIEEIISGPGSGVDHMYMYAHIRKIMFLLFALNS